ncbi:hypothetical protein AVEN_192627-1, partial [Araneus ventricosus]
EDTDANVRSHNMHEKVKLHENSFPL